MHDDEEERRHGGDDGSQAELIDEYSQHGAECGRDDIRDAHDQRTLGLTGGQPDDDDAHSRLIQYQ